MDFLQILGAAITFGSALGATLASLFAVRQKSLVNLLRDANNDYKNRVEQLESDRDSLQVTVERQVKEIEIIRAEKAIPLEKLTRLITYQHESVQKSIMELTKALAEKGK